MRIDTAETQGEKGVCTKPRMNQWAAFRFAKELIFAANACFFFVADCTCEIISLKNTRAPETGCECCVVMSSSSSVPLVAESCNNRLFKASVEGEAIPHLPGGPLRSSCNYRVEPTFTHAFAEYAALYRARSCLVFSLPPPDSPGRQVWVSQFIHKETETKNLKGRSSSCREDQAEKQRLHLTSGIWTTEPFRILHAPQ